MLPKIVTAMITAVCVLGCSPTVKNPDARLYYDHIVEFVEATADRDSAQLQKMAFDNRALKDAAVLRKRAPRILGAPRERLGKPYHVTVKGDTAVVFLRADERGEEEFGTEFRRIGDRWRIVRIGFTPR
jgi:hypothetical protein